jgi:hypothetical protein
VGDGFAHMHPNKLIGRNLHQQTFYNRNHQRSKLMLAIIEMKVIVGKILRRHDDVAPTISTGIQLAGDTIGKANRLTPQYIK